LRVLALNVGSSSLKAVLRSDPGIPRLALLAERLASDGATLRVGGDEATIPLEGGIGAAVEGVARFLADRELSPDAVAHRVVHGGPDHYRPCVVDDALLNDLQNLVTLAPLHLPPALEAVNLARRIWPRSVHVACFDTGYHHDLPETSIRLPLPVEVTGLGIRRYGFHGLSVQSVLLARPDLADAVIAHLGSGCSVTAVGSDRLPRHTSMSFTPASGMMSSTRAGDLDPEVLLFLIEHHGFTASDLRDVLDSRSGLFGVSGGRRDMRDLLDADDHYAKLALAMFVSSAAMAIAASATTLDRWRWLVFTGGVGEHAIAVRAQICDRLRLEGVEIVVVPADEERVMDEMTRTLMNSDHQPLITRRSGN
jgi:acetate kinase